MIEVPCPICRRMIGVPQPGAFVVCLQCCAPLQFDEKNLRTLTMEQVKTLPGLIRRRILKQISLAKHLRTERQKERN